MSLPLTLYIATKWLCPKTGLFKSFFFIMHDANYTQNWYAFYVCLLTLEYSEQILRVEKRLELFYSVGIKYTIHKSNGCIWIQLVCMLHGFIDAGYKIHRLLYLMFRWLLEPLQLNISEINITNALETISNHSVQCSSANALLQIQKNKIKI